MPGAAGLGSVAGGAPATPGPHSSRGLAEGGGDTGSAAAAAAHPGTPSKGPGSEYARFVEIFSPKSISQVNLSMHDHRTLAHVPLTHTGSGSSLQQLDAGLLLCDCRSDYARSEIGDGTASVVGGPDEQGPEHDLLPDLPPSWVPKLTVPRDMLDMRCPRVR